MKKIILSLLFIPMFFLVACNNEITAPTSTSSSSSISPSSASDTNYSQAETIETSSVNSGEQTFQQLDEIIGVWSNEDKSQDFAVTNRDYMKEDKKYAITGVDVNKEKEEHTYVISWDPELFVEEYGEPETFNPQPFVYDYDNKQDTLSSAIIFQRKSDSKQVDYIKDKLAGYEPINLEQLLDVDDQHLLAYWYKATTESDELAKQLATVYQEISIDYPDLKLLTGKKYEQYQSIAKEIEEKSDYSFSDLNTALPRDIYRWYIETNKEEVTEELLAKIKEAREQYFERKNNSKQPYLEESDKNEKGETEKSTDEDELDKELEKHIQEKIKKEFSEDIPKDHIVYDMTLEDEHVNIRVYQNQDKKLQYEVGFSYNIAHDQLTKQK